MKKQLLVVCLVLLACMAFSQYQYRDVVYLKNGSVIRGLISEQIPNESLKIVSGDNVFVFKMDEVERIVKEPVPAEELKPTQEPAKNNTPVKPTKTVQISSFKRGYHGMAEVAMGIAYGTEVNGANEMVKVNLVNGYRFNPHLAIGVSTGVRFLLKDDNYIVPIMGDLRVNMINRSASPYIALALGPVYESSSNFVNYGTMFGFGVGASIKVSERNSINIGLSYEAVGASDNDFFMSDVFSGKYRSFGVNCGITF